ncbi:MAG: hypothetical protein ACE5I1_21860 [bacterium]
MEQNKIHTEFSLLELQEAINTFRTGLSVLVQIVAVLVVANVTILGYAMSEKITGVIFLGAIIPLLIIIITRIVSNLLVPAVYTAYSIEKHTGENRHDNLMQIGLSVLSSQEFMQKLDQISREDGLAARAENLRALHFSLLGTQKNLIFSVLVFISFIQTLIPIFLSNAPNWRMF